MKRTFELDGDTIHDFRTEMLGWGWNGLYWEVAKDKQSVKMLGVGTGLKKGDYILLNQENKDLYYPINEIKYESNPRDSFECTLGKPYVLED